MKVYQCFMFLEKNSSTTYHNSLQRLMATHFVAYVNSLDKGIGGQKKS